MAACDPSPDPCCGDLDFAACPSLAAMVDLFLARRGQRAVREQAWWGDPTLSFAQACARAMFKLEGEGRRDGHQRPFSTADLKAMTERLAAAEPALKAAGDFEALRRAVEKALGYRPGRAVLLNYDVAQRLGCYLGKAPDEVYLHAGPRDGANALRPGLGRARRRPLKDFPTSLRTRLSPAQVEDFLCLARLGLRPELWD